MADHAQILMMAEYNSSPLTLPDPAAVLATYYEQEQQLFEQLRDLAMESARFKSWVAATLLVCKEAFQVRAHV